MKYPIDTDRARTDRANYCETMYIKAYHDKRQDLMKYWARQEYAALYPDGRTPDGSRM